MLLTDSELKADRILSHRIYGNLSFIELEDRLIIKPIDRDQFLAEFEGWENLSSYLADVELLQEMDGTFTPVGNGWQLLAPEQIGALVDDHTVLLSEEVKEDEDGDITDVGKLYFQHDAHFGSLVDKIIDKGFATLSLA